MKSSRNAARRVGRPLSFDRGAALERAMLLFWQRGYESTSLSALTAAMGINAPSVYAAFGSKKGLFRAAVARYLSGSVTSEGIIAGAATAEQAARGLLEAAAVGYTGAKTPRGCLLANSAVSSAAADVQAELAAIRHRVEALLKARVAAAVRSGELRRDADPAALAAHVMAVIQGMAILARDGASRAKLLRIAATAMRTWPSRRTGQ